MTSSTHDLHGVIVHLDSDLPPEMDLALIGRFPAAAPGGAAAGVVARLRFDLRPGARADSEARPLFFHGTLRARAGQDHVELQDDGCLLLVTSDGARIEGFVEPRLAADAHGFANVPLLVALVLALRAHGLFHVHAAALEVPGLGGVLLPAGAGSGKSTLALALADLGSGWLGDDAVFLARPRGAPSILGFPKPFHLGEATARAFPRLAAHLAPCGAPGKRALDPRTALPGLERAVLGPPAAVLVPSITGGKRTVVERISQAEAMGALVESSAFVMVEGLPRVSEQVALLGQVASAPICARVLLGRDLLEEPRASVTRMLAALRSLKVGPGRG